MDTETIKSIVSIEDVLYAVYGLEVSKRMPCPIHNGVNNNFSINGGYYKCFKCGASGDIFSLVQALSSVNFNDAKIIICEYFNLSMEYKIEDKKIIERKEKEKRINILLKKIRAIQQILICKALREIRYSGNDNFLEEHLENLLFKFESNNLFFIQHDIHAHLYAILNKHFSRNGFSTFICLSKDTQCNTFGTCEGEPFKPLSREDFYE